MALLDPELTLSPLAQLVASTGPDALTHPIESLASMIPLMMFSL